MYKDAEYYADESTILLGIIRGETTEENADTLMREALDRLPQRNANRARMQQRLESAHAV